MSYSDGEDAKGGAGHGFRAPRTFLVTGSNVVAAAKGEARLAATAGAVVAQAAAVGT